MPVVALYGLPIPTTPALVTEKAVLPPAAPPCRLMRLPALAFSALTTIPLTVVPALVVPVLSTMSPLVVLPAPLLVSLTRIFWPFAVTPVAAPLTVYIFEALVPPDDWTWPTQSLPRPLPVQAPAADEPTITMPFVVSAVSRPVAPFLTLRSAVLLPLTVRVLFMVVAGVIVTPVVEPLPMVMLVALVVPMLRAVAVAVSRVGVSMEVSARPVPDIQKLAAV